jgi:hypothetical protein
MQWILVTASFGAERFHESARRLVDQARLMGLFTHIVHVTESNIGDFAPKVWKKYKNFLNSRCTGFGFYAWKPEIVNSVLLKNPGFGVIYVDAGCELNGRFVARLRLKRLMRKTKNGGHFHVLKYPEIQYTKRKVLEFFSIEKEDAVSWQVQATWFMLSGVIGREISDRWLESCLIDISMVDDSARDEHEDFVENRYDQSLLSCVVKSMKIKPSRLRPCFRPLTFTSTVRCYLHPVWSARNRTGVSIQRKRWGVFNLG